MWWEDESPCLSKKLDWRKGFVFLFFSQYSLIIAGVIISTIFVVYLWRALGARIDLYEDEVIHGSDLLYLEEL